MPPRSVQAKSIPATYNCTACDKIIKSSLEAKLHPLIGCLICRKCYITYADGDFASNWPDGVDEFGDDNYCRWCLDGGDLFGCMNEKKEDGDRCHFSFCKDCIKKNVPHDSILTLDQLCEEEKEKVRWLCYGCDQSPIKKLRDEANEAIKNLTKKAEKKNVEPGPDTSTPKKRDEVKASSTTSKTCSSTTKTLTSTSRSVTSTTKTPEPDVDQESSISKKVNSDAEPLIPTSKSTIPVPKPTRSESKTSSSSPEPANSTTNNLSSDVKAAAAAANTTPKASAANANPKSAADINPKSAADINPKSAADINPLVTNPGPKVASSTPTSQSSNVDTSKSNTKVINSTPKPKSITTTASSNQDPVSSNLSSKKRKFESSLKQSEPNQPLKRRETTMLSPRAAPGVEIFPLKRRETVSVASKFSTLQNQSTKATENGTKSVANTQNKKRDSIVATKTVVAPADSALKKKDIIEKVPLRETISPAKKQDAADNGIKTTTAQATPAEKRVESINKVSNELSQTLVTTKTGNELEKPMNGVLSQRLTNYLKTKEMCIEEIKTKFETVVEMMSKKGLSKSIITIEIDGLLKPIEEFQTMLNDLRNHL